MEMDKIKEQISKVEEEGKELDQLEEEIVGKYTGPLDEAVKNIQNKRVDFNDDLIINLLCMGIQDLCPILYFSLAGLEKIGNRSDIAEQKRVKQYNKARNTCTGTAKDKDTFAEDNSANEKVVADLYKRCYKDLKARVDSGIFFVEGLRKELTVKDKEIQLTQAQNKIM